MHKTTVLNIVGLTPNLLRTPHTPRLSAFANQGALATITPPLPAVTTTVQSTYLTGCLPDQHGIVANGWYFRSESEIKFWRQSNHLVQRPKIWESARDRDPNFTCANLFWWYNMYSTADFAVTPRPMYPADGRKIPDLWTHPQNLRQDLQRDLGPFPLFHFWGPAASIRSTQWIADSALWIDHHYNPILTLIYLPHLDYCLQRLGPDPAILATDLQQLDSVAAKLLDHYQSKNARIIILSEYGITPVSRPVHLNRILRHAGLIATRDELGHELLDPGASHAFAVADHQIAHIYVNDPAKLTIVRRLLDATPGVARVLDKQAKIDAHLDHPRSGELIALADPDAFFTYYYWLDDKLAPDFAHTVDIHRKPGYDPAELFLDPQIPFPKLNIAWTLLKKKLGFRTLMQLIPTNADQVRGSHGLLPPSPDLAPLFITHHKPLLPHPTLASTQIHDLILQHVFEKITNPLPLLSSSPKAL